MEELYGAIHCKASYLYDNNASYNYDSHFLSYAFRTGRSADRTGSKGLTAADQGEFRKKVWFG